MQTKTTIGLMLIIAMSLSNSSRAQLFRRRHMKEPEQAPKVLLVQLPSYQRMVSYYQKNRQTKKAGEVMSEAEKAAKAMIKDFKNNFHYCRVYFFYDTNAATIQKGGATHLLFNADKEAPGEDLLRNPNFLVTYYGLAQQEGSLVETRAGLVIMGPDFMQKVSPFPYRVFPSPDSRNKLYSYISQKYEIEYIATARELDKTLRKYYDESWLE